MKKFKLNKNLLTSPGTNLAGNATICVFGGNIPDASYASFEEDELDVKLEEESSESKQEEAI